MRIEQIFLMVIFFSLNAVFIFMRFYSPKKSAIKEEKKPENNNSIALNQFASEKQYSDIQCRCCGAPLPKPERYSVESTCEYCGTTQRVVAESLNVHTSSPIARYGTPMLPSVFSINAVQTGRIGI